MPDKDDELKKFLKAVSAGDTEKALLKSAEQEFSTEYKVLKETGENLIQTLENKAKDITTSEETLQKETTPPPPNSQIPSLNIERLENNLRSKTVDAGSTVMHPQTPVIEKSSHFFKDVKYDVGLANIEARKEINKLSSISADIDFFDKTATLNYKRNGNNKNTTISAGAGYNPFKQRVKFDVRYTMPNQNIRGKIYLQKDNSGVNVSYGKKISKDHTLNAKAAVFEKDAAFEIELKKKVKKTDIAIGTGGYTNYPSHIIYTYARIGF